MLHLFGAFKWLLLRCVGGVGGCGSLLDRQFGVALLLGHYLATASLVDYC